MTFLRLFRPVFGMLLGALAVARSTPARAFSPYLVVPDPDVAETSPAYRYANMSDAEAIAELDQRKILYTKLDAVPGVRTPIRLTGRLHGVYIHSSLPPDERVSSMFEILDARLALALDDFAAILERHDIDEVVHFTMYRPNVANVAMHEHSHDIDDEPTITKLRGISSRSRASRPAHKPLLTPVTPGKAAPKASVGKTVGKPAPGLGAKGTLDTSKGGTAPSGFKQKPDPFTPKPEVMVTRKPSPKAITLVQPGSQPKSGKPAPSTKGAPGNMHTSGAIARRDAGLSRLHKTSWAPPGTRHPAGLAIDVGLLHKRDGRWLSVARHFHGRIGDKTCGQGVNVPDDPDGRELHALVCEASDLGVFTYTLTPNYNAAHADHFHMEIKPGVRWFLYH